MNTLEQQYDIHITTPKEIPPILAQEIEELGLPISKIYAAGVATVGTLQTAMMLNYTLRTGHRVLLLLRECFARTPDDVYREAQHIPWEDFIPVDGYFSVVSSINTESIRNTQFANVKLKDAIVDRIRNAVGKRPNSGSDTTQCVVYLYWKDASCSIYIDTSGVPLSKRGYRVNPHKAPMSEVLAAAVIRAAQWNPREQAFINPMCGSGTLAIEAALLATNTPAQRRRSQFAFMFLRQYNSHSWDEVKRLANEKIIKPSRPIICSDRSSEAIMATRRNAHNAGVAEDIIVEMGDYRSSTIPDESALIILNPEYGERLGSTNVLAQTYTEIGNWFKHLGDGKIGAVFTGNSALAKSIGLKTFRKIPFYNADIECRLLMYQLYSGSKKHNSNPIESYTETPSDT